jgi:hypothetical protein
MSGRTKEDAVKKLVILSLVMMLSVVVLSTALANGGRPLSTVLAGANEVPGPGDPDGTGVFSMTANSGQEEICYELSVANIAPATAAHIHRAPAGVPGPVVVPLVAPTNGSSSACASVPRDLVKEIRKNPEAFYVNVHNAMFPAGAIRGQLSK